MELCGHWRVPTDILSPYSQFSCNPALKALQSPALPASVTAGITSLIPVLSLSESPWLPATLLKG